MVWKFYREIASGTIPDRSVSLALIDADDYPRARPPSIPPASPSFRPAVFAGDVKWCRVKVGIELELLLLRRKFRWLLRASFRRLMFVSIAHCLPMKHRILSFYTVNNIYMCKRFKYVDSRSCKLALSGDKRWFSDKWRWRENEWVMQQAKWCIVYKYKFEWRILPLKVCNDGDVPIDTEIICHSN